MQLNKQYLRAEHIAFRLVPQYVGVLVKFETHVFRCLEGSEVERIHLIGFRCTDQRFFIWTDRHGRDELLPGLVGNVTVRILCHLSPNGDKT